MEDAWLHKTIRLNSAVRRSYSLILALTSTNKVANIPRYPANHTSTKSQTKRNITEIPAPYVEAQLRLPQYRPPRCHHPQRWISKQPGTSYRGAVLRIHRTFFSSSHERLGQCWVSRQWPNYHVPVWYNLGAREFSFKVSWKRRKTEPL